MTIHTYHTVGRAHPRRSAVRLTDRIPSLDPGDEYVDWNGISLYWKGAVYRTCFVCCVSQWLKQVVAYLANEALPQDFVQNNLAWGPNFYE